MKAPRVKRTIARSDSVEPSVSIFGEEKRDPIKILISPKT